MKVVFLQDVTNVARAGDVKTVADGFARNYLLPQRLAALATPEQMKRIERIKAAADERRAKEMTELGAVVERLNGQSVTLAAKAGPNERYYGSIGPSVIARALQESTSVPVERRWLELPEPITKPGTYEVTVRLSPSLAAKVTVVAEKE